MNIRNLEKMIGKYNQAVESGKTVELMYNQRADIFSIEEFASENDRTFAQALGEDEENRWFISMELRRFYRSRWGNCPEAGKRSRVTVDNVLAYILIATDSSKNPRFEKFSEVYKAVETIKALEE